MATNFPASLDTLTNPSATDTLDSPPHDEQHADANDAIEALQAKVGVDSSAVTSSLDYKVATLETDVTALETGYRYHSTVYFTSSGTFTKASYPWLRAMRVKVVGAGGGGGGSPGGANMACAGAGGGAGYSESFITDIAGLAASETVTVGSGGAGGAAGSNPGSTGGNSSFGSLVTANGGGGGTGGTKSGTYPSQGSRNGVGGLIGTGDLTQRGSPSTGRSYTIRWSSGDGQLPETGNSVFGVQGSMWQNNASPGTSQIGGIGAGGGPGWCTSGQPATPGGSGGDGMVIVELYA